MGWAGSGSSQLRRQGGSLPGVCSAAASTWSGGQGSTAHGHRSLVDLRKYTQVSQVVHSSFKMLFVFVNSQNVMLRLFDVNQGKQIVPFLMD